MALTTSYKTGTVAVAAGATAVTGTGTNWTGAGIRAGDVLWAGGIDVAVLSVESATRLTLAFPWPGAALNGAAYELRYTPDASRVLASSREAILSVEADRNEVRQISAGGTGASTAANARANLGAAAVDAANTFTAAQSIDTPGDQKLALRGSDAPYLPFYRKDGTRFGILHFDAPNSRIRLSIDGGITLDAMTDGRLLINNKPVPSPVAAWDTPGCMSLMLNKTSSQIAAGAVVPGSSLAPARIRASDGVVVQAATAVTGSWQAMQVLDAGTVGITMKVAG